LDQVNASLQLGRVSLVGDVLEAKQEQKQKRQHAPPNQPARSHLRTPLAHTVAQEVVEKRLFPARKGWLIRTDPGSGASQIGSAQQRLTAATGFVPLPGPELHRIEVHSKPCQITLLNRLHQPVVGEFVPTVAGTAFESDQVGVDESLDDVVRQGLLTFRPDS
jgi:hypothetical protein